MGGLGLLTSTSDSGFKLAFGGDQVAVEHPLPSPVPTWLDFNSESDSGIRKGCVVGGRT